MTNTFIVDSVGGISGSLTKLVDGTSYLVAGENISIVSQSNGSVLVSAQPPSPTPSWFYGDGREGDVVIDSNQTLSEDLYCTSLFITEGYTLKTNGKLIMVRGPCVISGVLDNSGASAIHGVSAGGVGGVGGGNGGKGQPTHNSAQNGVTVTQGIAGLNAHGGGGYLAGDPGAYIGGSTSDQYVRGLPQALLALGNVSGGGGGGGSANSTGGGGGGGVILLVAVSIYIASSGEIRADGGDGDGDTPGGSGGGGGGLIILISQTPAQNDGIISVASGSAGTGYGGNPGGDGIPGGVIQMLM